MEIDEPSVEVGTRFTCEGFYGTVRYVGSVPPTDGIWLGVEWDDPLRGKHNGTYNEQKYFTTRNPKSGSFLRPKKVELGISFLEAVYDRYKNEKSEPKPSEEEELYIVMKDNSILPVEAVGYEKIKAKQSRLERLLEVSVSRKRVSHPGTSGTILETVPNIVELDLSVNLLSSWEDVAVIADQLKNLEILNLSENILQIPKDPERFERSFVKLKVIVLSNVSYNWQEILSCSTMWPRIREMRVPFNAITTIEIPNDMLKDLEYLDLEANPLVDWSHVKQLGLLPKLKTLNLNGTGLTSLSFEETPTASETTLFPVLECLMLQNNKLSKWSDIDELDKLPSLSEIAFMNNPLCCSESVETFRQIMVAKIGSLSRLNRSLVSDQERRGAEWDYVKRQGSEWLRLSNAQPTEDAGMKAFLAVHPRFPQLIAKHGIPEEAEMKKESNTLIGNLISIEIVNAKQMDQKHITKKFPGSLTVNKLRYVIQKLLRLDVHGLSLWCVSKKNPEIKVLMDNDMRQLSFYAENGDQILVE